jgi:hypothetical protein
LTAPLFVFEALPPLSLKGKAQPVAAYRLLTARAAPGSLRGIEGLRSPLVGRDEEMARLREAFGALLDQGQGGALAIMGEAGQGKSRLVAEARAASLSSTVLWAEGRALSYAENISYFVARDLLRGLVNAPAEASPDAVAAALRGSVEELVGDRVAQVYPYLARLLDVPLDDEMAERVRYLSAEALAAADASGLLRLRARLLAKAAARAGVGRPALGRPLLASAAGGAAAADRGDAAARPARVPPGTGTCVGLSPAADGRAGKRAVYGHYPFPRFPTAKAPGCWTTCCGSRTCRKHYGRSSWKKRRGTLSSSKSCFVR